MLRTGIVAACAVLSIGMSCSRKRAPSKPRADGGQTAPLFRLTPVAPEENGKLLADEMRTYTEILAHHVVFHDQSSVPLRTEWLRARLYPARPNVIPSLDDPSSFRVEIYDGTLQISTQTLSRQLNARLSRNSKFTKVRVSSLGPNKIQINATLHKGLSLPLQLVGNIGTTPDGRLRIQLTSWRVLKLPLKGLMKAIKLDASDLVHLPESQGMEVRGNTVYIRPEDLLPPPKKMGLVTGVYFNQAGDLVEQYGKDRSDAPVAGTWPGGRWHNYLRLEGGSIHFGKLTMTNADMILIDTSPGDWYDFDLAHYREQIVKGSMFMTPDGGLRVFTPDSTKIGRP
jgi:hypothetical protein